MNMAKALRCWLPNRTEKRRLKMACPNPKCKNPDCTCGDNCKCDEKHQCSEGKKETKKCSSKKTAGKCCCKKKA